MPPNLDLFGNPLPDEPPHPPTVSPKPSPAPPPEWDAAYWGLRGRVVPPEQVVKEGLVTTIWNKL